MKPFKGHCRVFLSKTSFHHKTLRSFFLSNILKLCLNPMKNDMIYGNRKRVLMEIHHFNCTNRKWFSDFDGFTWVSILMRAYSVSVWILSVDIKKIFQFATLYHVIWSGWFFRNKLDIWMRKKRMYVFRKILTPVIRLTSKWMANHLCGCRNVNDAHSELEPK